jgi:succinyl-CoA synthetase beta subunit
MNIHEYQAKKILQKYQIPVPEFYVVSSIEELKTLLQKIGWKSAVLKVQIHAGGRGKAGGVKLAKSPDEILKYAQELLGKKIVNEQTGPEGMVANQILISPTVEIAKEYYLGAVINRELAQGVLIASPVGGIEIEAVAKEKPEQVLIMPIPPEGYFNPSQLNHIVNFMGWENDQAKQGIEMIIKLVHAFAETDASLIEINPLVKTNKGDLLALDAKLVIDDNALFRQPELKTFFDPTQVSPLEASAQKHDLAYVALDGEIGCMVNGAGLAMATMDIIDHFGGTPANFLDIGGSATKEKVSEGFKIILSDPKVKAILINIFGGIMSCETVAEGVIAAAKELHVHVPLVVRIEGTNVEKGRKLIAESHIKNIVIADNLADAAEKVVGLRARSKSMNG